MLTEQTRVALSVFSMAAGVLMVFAVIAMILTALGTYGLVSYAVKQSTHEIGIRIAIGASRAQLLRRFLERGLRLGAAGALCGLVAARQPVVRGQPDRRGLVHCGSGRCPDGGAGRVVCPGLARITHRSDRGASPPLVPAPV